MKKKITVPLVCLVILYLSSLAFSQPKKILIKVVVDSLPANSSIFLTGNIDELGNWNFMQVMEKKPENIWQKEVFAKVGDTLQFKLTEEIGAVRQSIQQGWSFRILFML